MISGSTGMMTVMVLMNFMENRDMTTNNRT